MTERRRFGLAATDLAEPNGSASRARGHLVPDSDGEGTDPGIGAEYDEHRDSSPEVPPPAPGPAQPQLAELLAAQKGMRDQIDQTALLQHTIHLRELDRVMHAHISDTKQALADYQVALGQHTEAMVRATSKVGTSVGELKLTIGGEDGESGMRGQLGALSKTVAAHRVRDIIVTLSLAAVATVTVMQWLAAARGG